MTVAVDQLSLSAANYLCPHCGAPIPLDDVNVATDLALCRKCGQTSPFSALAEAASAAHEPLTLPKGVSFDQTFDGFRIVCSTRSKTAFFIVPFMLIWSGVSVGGIYGTQLAKGHFNLMTSLFGIPFLLGTVALGCLSLMTVCGHVVIEKKGRLLECLTGGRGHRLPETRPLVGDQPCARRTDGMGEQWSNPMAVAAGGR